MRKRVCLAIIFLFFVYLIYLFFFSANFKITGLNLIGTAGETPTTEIEKAIWDSIHSRRFLIFPGDNYFFVSLNNIQRQFQEKNILAELSLKKKFPHALEVEVKERLGKLIWVSGEQFYVLELDGKVSSQLYIKELVNVKMPVVYNLANLPVVLGQDFVDKHLIDLMLAIYTDFSEFELPSMDLDYFKVDGPKANYVKIVTKQGFEIHVSYLSSLENQFDKLKKSLLAGKIDLKKINYINLRVENQVIYK